MAKAKDVARYIVTCYRVDNLKLQKLLYYSQGVYMTLHEGKPLFMDEIEAWTYGPVVPSVYASFKDESLLSGGLDISKSEDLLSPFNLSADEIEAISMTLEYYGRFSGVELINMTHRETPWKAHFNPENIHTVIPRKSIYDFFSRTLRFEEG